MKKKSPSPDMAAEYDFSGGVRGKYAERYGEGSNAKPAWDGRQSMKHLQRAVFVVGALFAFVVIGVSGDFREYLAQESVNKLLDATVASTLLMLTMGYLHWALPHFLLPLDGLSDRMRRVVTSNARTSGFYGMCIGLGYLLALVHCGTYFFLDIETPSNSLSGAVFLFLLGLFNYSRTVTKALVREIADQNANSREDERSSVDAIQSMRATPQL
ncbi:MAG: hypothetical protein WC655_29080 [Candidatus Hydrogenedentales bacterium]|jgi:hypothetical protein